MAARAKKPPGDEGTPTTGRPARLRVMRPEVEEVLKSPRRGRPKLQQHKDGEGAASEDAEDAAFPRYDCTFQDEKEEEGGGFAPPAMVWCKVRSHPWWPGQVFDAADASELALRHARAGSGAPLVAYFWDRTFAWTDPSALLPFRANFSRLAGRSAVSSYVSSVDAALQEVERRVEAGLSCACPFAAAGVVKKQEVKNSGIREGAYGAVVEDAYMRDTFRGEPFLEYISALAANPLAGADRLDLLIAKAQLRSFNRLRVPRELPEFVIYEGIEGVTAEATPNTKRKKMEKSGEDDVIPSKEKKPRRGESSLPRRDAASEEAVDEDSSVPRKSSARKKTSKDVDKREPPAKKDAMAEGSSVPSSKQSKSKISKSAAEKKKKKDPSKDTDKGESLEEPAEEDATNEDSSMPTAEVTDGTLSKGGKSKISKSSAKTKKKDTSKGADKKESLTEPAMEEATGDDTSTPSGGVTDDTMSKETKSKISRSSAKKKKQDTSKDADKKESLPEPAEEDATNVDSSMPTVEATDGTLSKERKSSRISAKKKTQEISKDADKKEPLPEPAQEEATGDDSSTPVATDGTLSKETKSKTSKSSTKKTKQDTSKGTDGLEPAAGNKMSVNKAVDVTLSDGKSGRRLRSTKKMEDASEGLKGPKKNGAAETTKGKDKDAALLKENNLGRRASSARQKNKITEDGDRLAGSSVKDSVLPGKKKSQVGEISVTKDSPISEHGIKRKKLSELLVETDTPNRSLGGKSKAQGKRSLPVSIEKPDRDTEDTVKTRGKRPLPASAEKPDRDTEDTVKTRGKRSLPALAEKHEDPNRDMTDKMKTRGKRSLPVSTEEPEDPDRDTKDTMKTTKRKKLATLGDLSSQPPLSPKGSTKGREATPKAAGKKSHASLVVKANGDTLGDSPSQQQPLSPKRSTKAREVTCKAAELKPHTSHVVKANGEASQTRSRRTKNSEVTVSDKSPQSVKLNKGKKGASTEDSLSCGEMHSQLCLAASDLKKVVKITPASVGFFTEFSKSSCPSSADVEKEIPIEAVNTDSYASSPHADEETPEEAAEKVISPHANEETPEEAANKVVSPHADKEIPEKPTDNMTGPSGPPVDDHMKDDFWADIPSEPPVADHMKDDYWADILINVEEPISSLKRKKGKSKSKTSKTKERQAEDASTKEPPASARKVEVEEPTAAESKQDNMENGKAETKAVNGGQPNTEEMVAAENPSSLAGLVLHFSRADAVPSRSDLIKIFSQYGPVSEVRMENAGDSGSSSVQVVFRRRMDAEAAFGGAGKMTSLLGPALVSFRLSDFPSGGAVAASGNGSSE